MSTRARILVIGGPTAAGKTQVALTIAERTGAVILSADAMQVYRGMDIGTGKSRPSARCGIPHFGIDLRNPDQPFDVADFIAHADRVFEELTLVRASAPRELALSRGAHRGHVDIQQLMMSCGGLDRRGRLTGA